MRESFKQVFKYGIVGVIGMGVEWGIFFLVRDFFHINYIIAHVSGCICAIINNFVLNSYFTFKATDKIWSRAVSFFAIAGVGLLVGLFLLPSFVKIIDVLFVDNGTLEISQKVVQNIAKLATTVIVACVQFIFNKFYTFKKQKA